MNACMTQTEFILLGQFGFRLLLTLPEVCTAIGYSKQTAYNDRARGQFPVQMRRQGNKLVADIRDVAVYLDSQRKVSA